MIPIPYSWLAGLVLGALAMAAAYHAGAQHQRQTDTASYNAERLAQSKATLSATESAFRTYQDGVIKARQVSSAYQQSIAALGTKISMIKLGYTDYVRTHPLPADCSLDPFRLQHIQDAIDAANAAASGGDPR